MFNVTPWVQCTFRLAFAFLLANQALSTLVVPALSAEASTGGESAYQAPLEFAQFVAINALLFVFNLVPIPVLDGGQLSLFAIEAVKRGPLSFRTRQIAAYIGFALIVMIMVLAFKNDIERNWDRIVDYISSD